ncbi:HEPN domain-containing protein [Methanomassiliicoccus luminyensis]|uniref:HEPN domain-containing protein n=1 Tax=Methanomassiliicoccus luminyensis TaxID=1080712 RepID=UPI0003788CEC|nr:HEPN domain-containing protein [Methanomassiliicoccus luminyensis]
MLINIDPDDDPMKNRFRAFEEDLRDGNAFFRRAEEFTRDGYGHSLIFNVAAIALERYLVGLCHLHGIDPDNHNFICLMDAVETMVNIPPKLDGQIRWLDESIFGICSLDNYYHGAPEKRDADMIMSLCRQVRDMFVPEEIAARRAKLRMDESGN